MYVERIRKDVSIEKGIALWIVADNLRKGAALNAIQIAEFLNSQKNDLGWGWHMINIGILGLGTVATGVTETLEKNKKYIEQKIGKKINIKKVLVKNINKPRKVNLQDKLTTNPDEVLEDGSIEIIVELIGGEEPAFTFLKKALNNGKHVVTANKELISIRGRELFELAKNKRKQLLFEASVAGGIPIVRPLKQCLASNDIKEIMGIINGTTNYILTEMKEKGASFDEILKNAQKKGYAESDPTADVEGLDAARKLSILSSIAFNSRITPDKIYTQGITQISQKDIQYATELDHVIKLVAWARKKNGEIECMVSPTLVPKKHPLANVNDVYNAVMVKGYPVGDVMFFGQGAGKDPTASAVVADIIDIVKNLNNKNMTWCTCFMDRNVVPYKKIESQFYIRMNVVDKPGVLAKIAKAFGDNNVSLSSVVQKNTTGSIAEIVLITYKTSRENLDHALKKIKSLSQTKKISTVLKVEGGE